MKGKRWRFDGEKVYLLGGREWTIPMPANRDLAIAVKDALASNQVSATSQNNMIRFEADDDGVVRIRAAVNEAYSQQRLNPYDEKFFKVYPTKGEINWASLVERTDAMETDAYEGTGAKIVHDPPAGTVIKFGRGWGQRREV